MAASVMDNGYCIIIIVLIYKIILIEETLLVLDSWIKLLYFSVGVSITYVTKNIKGLKLAHF